MASFLTANDFLDFANVVRREMRFFHTDTVAAFLATVVETGKDRELSVKSGAKMWRAQTDFDDWPRSNDDGHEWTEERPFNPERMKPLMNNPPEGRANPRGIAYLYLATDCDTAISEVRPWSGALVSVGLFETLRELKIADFTRHEGKLGSFDVLMRVPIGRLETPTPAEIEEAVWADIDTAFSRPVGPQDEQIDSFAHQAPRSSGARIPMGRSILRVDIGQRDRSRIGRLCGLLEGQASTDSTCGT